ncbi:16S rRNA (cytosine(1402)-N(4))-methyltransferase [Mycoplasmopsis pullorum]|uniref:16S rRNA (cytosine(1402)-N(4))-methyltransferase RsmH n=1 Tax=Mycoplasmopsis pullorum TaxID=48003 RepID=UPI0011191F9F|nr:16S rRNA (cytosine(1402)-N(4))-methyltransferase RsmH [Mycoplasmopsis pullorum]TNK81705.1 16S rRNA (cytosine(1402)-N(4))-methyltransferase [Mycoplasmopsis pullorum]TNK84111.1 16S rRNA (cytosine(1402)-N(4))-methyltransferase [Mycoplasmopsis pullorum]TNK85322.1 16S rRNA (cytosine(1402)-N(4))-methyltransferase [Mycoplasmopsis pullorum]TNK85453.1 16S rRNA (cytosine(1402)-N(4))-methyltransferase [Mycoplasmopsis pullorum]TNK86766.1 16S rRNA (cytosine(1402)-N(4))-methyltransferase [Mycoplasmopsis 
MNQQHYSVLLNETIESLDIKPDGVYVDLTLGLGGHSAEILKKLNQQGLLIGFDKDEYAIEKSRRRLSQIADNFILIRSDFRNIRSQLMKLKIDKVDGIIADLGVSSPQLDISERGFSYNKDARLDMRMNQDQEIDAYYIVNNYDEVALTQILIKHADVKLAKQVAKAIIKSRPITTTLELVDVIKSAYPAAILRQKNPAKAVFQAIRIEVNDEFNAIHTMLNDSLDLLKPNGHLAIITFHSLEDKIVKNFFGNLIKDKLPSKMPVNEIKNYNARQIKPSQAELLENKRSRSAKLRVLTKIS